MSARWRRPDTARRIALFCGLASVAGFVDVAGAADDETPDLEFLEDLGSWEGSDEEWLLFDETAAAAQEVEQRGEAPVDGPIDGAADGPVPGSESTELENES